VACGQRVQPNVKAELAIDDRVVAAFFGIETASGTGWLDVKGPDGLTEAGGAPPPTR
jgi:hypothetical protein